MAFPLPLVSLFPSLPPFLFPSFLLSFLLSPPPSFRLSLPPSFLLSLPPSFLLSLPLFPFLYSLQSRTQSQMLALGTRLSPLLRLGTRRRSTEWEDYWERDLRNIKLFGFLLFSLFLRANAHWDKYLLYIGLLKFYFFRLVLCALFSFSWRS